MTVWAKSIRDETGLLTHWLPLQQHLDDTGAIADLLVNTWLPGGRDGVRRLAVWLARVHDVGKASPAFAVQVPVLADRMREAGLVASPMLLSHPQRSRVRHDLVGHSAVRQYVLATLPGGGVLAEQLGSVVGSHHGVPPEMTVLRETEQYPELVGHGAWHEARQYFLDRASADVDFAPYEGVRLSRPALALLTAVVIMADWIASNADFFPLLEAHEQPQDLDSAERAALAWKLLGFPKRWHAVPVGPDVDSAVRARFLPDAPGARPVQREAVLMAAEATRPGLTIIEAPMGSGKTEAALLAAEQLAAGSGADGVFVALPTQATTDAMFGRVRRWLDVLPGRDGTVSVTLAHGKASLNEEFDGLVAQGRFATAVENDQTPAIAHTWLRGRKKGILASFVVGTIDQVLFAGLKSRHLMLRHLGLAGKVVIIDEVHAYDVYMSQYLHRVLHWLGAYEVPVVLLSATLPAQRRAELASAYEHRPAGPGTVSGYPVITASGMPARVLPMPDRSSQVALDRLPDDLDELVRFLLEHLREGGCAVVVRNTVARVQETAARLDEVFGRDQVTVSHSRFLACDRARIDRDLLRRFGPRGDRPGLHIVVASQVVEQSLDVDFDLMVTDLAPTDLFLQRLGRLHRHDRTRPGPVAQPRCAVVGVQDWASDPVRAVPGSRRVYGEHLLLRSAALLRTRRTVALPDEIAPLVQDAYGPEPLGPPSWQAVMERAADEDRLRRARRVEAAQSFLLDEVGSNRHSLAGWVRAGVGDTDDDPRGAAQVRDGAESLEVLVVQCDASGVLSTPDWIELGGGQPLPTDLPIEAAQAKTVAACALRLPVAMSHPGVDMDVIAALEANRFPGFDASPLLRGQLVLVLDRDRTARISHDNADFRLAYSPREGLVHERR